MASAGLGILVGLVLMVLFYVAWFKIITKAGFSGWWLLVPLAPFILYPISLLEIARSADPFGSSFSISHVKGWLIFDAVIYVAEWVFFFIFAFSKWPALHAPSGTSHPAPAVFAPTPSRQAPTAMLPSGPPQRACPGCNQPFDVETPYCGTCGTRLREPAAIVLDPPSPAFRRCARCGRAQDASGGFCGNCGQELPDLEHA